MDTETADSRLITKSNLTRRDLDGETILLDVDTGFLHLLNPTAAMIWELLQTQTPLTVIEKYIAMEYDIDPHRAKQDTKAFLDQLKSAGLISEASG